MLEFDLIGSSVTLTDRDARLLLAAAEADSGSSIGSRDLATRLRALPDLSPPTAGRYRLVFTRVESRSLQRVIQTRIEPANELKDLRAALDELLVVRSGPFEG
jgi:hypothetical protein